MGRNIMELPAASWAEFRQLFSAFFSAVLGNTVIFDGVKPGNMSAVKHYGVCSTAAATAEKAVTCAGFTLVEGAKIAVKFTVTNTAANPTLNANSTGAKAIYYRGAAISAGYLAANRTYQFVYNGTQYELVGDLNTDTNNVTAQNISATNATYPILLGNTANATANIGNKATLFGAGVKVNPSTSEVIATKFIGALDGKAASAAAADNAAKVNNLTVETAVPTNAKFTDTTYSNFVKSGSGAKAGLVPAPSTTAGTAKYLREDGTWQVPPDNNTTYTAASATPLANGTAAVGTSAKYAREDHVHPLQTSVSGSSGSCTGNAATATKAAQLTTARTVDGVSFNGTVNITHYGSCSTAATTVEKTVACSGFTLATGAEINVKFTVTNTATSPTLNVNSTGAKAIYYRGAAISAGYLAANRTYRFVYNGTQYELIGDLDTNTNNVTAQNISTANNTYPILLGNTANATANIGNKAALFGSGVKVNPSTSEVIAAKFTGALNGNVTGNCSGSSGSCTGNAATATKATGDKNGADITMTYVKNARVQQGNVTIYNKFVVAGCVVKAAAVSSNRNLQLTLTGTYVNKNRSTFYADGGIHTILDGVAAAVPSNSSSSAATYYACIVKNASTGVYELKVQASKTGVLSLYRITVPANHTGANLTNVTITDERRMETSYGQFYASRPYVSVALPTAFSNADYDVSLRATSWKGVDIGDILAYDLANNGFKVEVTGAADNINIRWVATAKS